MPKTKSVKSKHLSFARSKKPGSSNLFWFILIVIALPILVWAVYQQTQTKSKASSIYLTPFGNVIRFLNGDTNNTFATAKPTTPLSQNPFTVEAWVKVSKPSSGNYIRVYPILMYTKPQTWVDYGYIFKIELEVQETSGQARPFFSALVANSTSNLNSNYIGVGGGSSIIIEPDTWNHIAVTSFSDGNFCTVKMYVNGISDGSITMYRQSCQISTLQPQEFRIARHHESSGGISGYDFTGDIDDVRISNIIRYTSDFSIPNLPFIPDDNTLLLYHFDEQPGSTIVQDSSNYQTHATISGQLYDFIPSTIIPSPTPTPTPTPPSTVPFKNSSFEDDSNGDGLPDSWVRTNKSDSTDVRTDAFAQDGTYSFKFTGIKGTTKSLSQRITGSWNAGTTLYFSGFAKTVNPNPKGIVRIVVQAKYTDNTLHDFTLLFPSNASYDWMQKNGTITLPQDTKRLTIRIMYQNQTGEGYFDSLYLSSNMPAGIQGASLPKLPAQTATSEF